MRTREKIQSELRRGIKMSADAGQGAEGIIAQQINILIEITLDIRDLLDNKKEE